MSQVNFALIFFFGLILVYFSLENNTPTTVKIYKNINFSLPLAVLLLIAGGVGAFAAWSFAAWNGLDIAKMSVV
tara:strand:- start:135 stop:356 length:222 start_codon:yes stop_codon:yes gene_type:complete